MRNNTWARSTWYLLALLVYVLSHPVYSQEIIQLTTSEREPYIGQDLPHGGYVSELVSEVYRRVGQDVELVFYPLARAKHYAKTGSSDGFVPTYYDPELESDFSFSDPFPGDYIGLLKQKDQFPSYIINQTYAPYETLRELEKHRFGIVIGSNLASSFIDTTQIFKVVHDRQNVVMLGRGRIDFAVIDKYTAADIMVTKFPHLIGQLEFMQPPLWKNEFRVAFSKATQNYQKKLHDFNSGLGLLKKENIVEEIASKHGLFPPQELPAKKVKLRIATVNNNDMLVMQKLSEYYEEKHPNIELEWRILEESILRKRLLADLAISSGEFDIMTIGSFEAPIWAERGWILPITQFPKNYDVNDILEPIRNSLTYQEKRYALPFYGESSMTFYRKDLFKKAGLNIADQPTYEDIHRYAARLHDPDNELYGICLRGQAGWGANMAYVNTLVNTFGGRWFDEQWNATIDTPEWHKAITIYKELSTKFGPPNLIDNNFNENLHLFANGHCAMWIDATVAAGMLFNPSESKVHQQVGFARAPIEVTQKGSNWLWAWSLAIPASSKVSKEAQEFITWATSQAYIELVANNEGRLSVPPGTRQSTYENNVYKEKAPFSEFVLKAIQTADPLNNTLKASPYNGIQFVGIPEFPALGDKVGMLIQQVIEEKMSIDQALKNAQALATDQMRSSGYHQ